MNTTNHHAPRPAMRRVGIVGADALGIGIAMRLLDADIPVTVFEPDRAALASGVALARSHYEASVAHGALAGDRCERRMALLAGAVNFHHLKDCDLVIDAMGADGGARESLFRRLDQVAKPDAILAACTAHDDVDRIAGFTRRPDRVLGLDVAVAAGARAGWMPVRARETSDDTLAAVSAVVWQVRNAGATTRT